MARMKLVYGQHTYNDTFTLEQSQNCYCITYGSLSCRAVFTTRLRSRAAIGEDDVVSFRGERTSSPSSS